MEWERITEALQCEDGIAGSLLMEPKETLALIRGKVSASDFCNDNARAIFQAAGSLIDSGKPCDTNLLQVEASVPVKYCRDAMIGTPTIVNASEYARIVHDAAQQRRVQEIGDDLSAGKLDAVAALAKLQELMRTQSGGIISPQETAQSAMDVFSAAADGSLKPFLSTGYKSLDRMLSGGLANGGLITIAARPGTGKTTAALNLAENVCAAGGTVLYISLEMTSAQIWACRVANAASLNRSDVLSGRIISRGIAKDRSREEKGNAERLYSAFEALNNRNFYILDKPATVDDIERYARTINNLALIVVDQIGLIKNTSRGTRFEFITGISHELKQLALSLRIPVLALCQLNRASTLRARPTMADLRDSGAIEEDSDVVILLYRDHQPGAQWEPVEFIIDKNRHGTTGILELGFSGPYSRIAEGCA